MGKDIKQMHAVFETYTGLTIDVLNPLPEMIDILDIAKALSNICRSGGHREFLSVAQHSCLVCDLAPLALKPVALLHDSAEAYLGDLISPLKYHMPGFRATETTLLSVILEKYNVDYTLYREIKIYDQKAFEMEKGIMGWFPHKAEVEFLHRFYKYVEGR